MKLSSPVKLEPKHFPIIKPDNKLVFIGSCFSENIGSKYLFPDKSTLVNPMGILFHPGIISDILDPNYKAEKEACLEFFKGYVHFDFQKKINGSTTQECLNNITTQHKKLCTHLKQAHTLFITLGTAWYYWHKKLNRHVGNCHKIPQQEFDKRIWKQNEIISLLGEAILNLRKINPEINVVFTVSPVKHLKDGIVENMQSKANLISAISEIVENLKNCYYFPSYEILSEELRDYRFYKDDLAHPSEMAIEYIHEKFQMCFCDSTLVSKQKEFEAILKYQNHLQYTGQKADEKLEQLKTSFQSNW